MPPGASTLRQFGFLCLLFFGAIATLAAYRQAPTLTILTPAALAIAGGLAGYFSPRLLRPVFIVWSAAVFPIGWCVSHLLLALLFYGLFTPLGLILRSTRRDPLQLHHPPRSSHWQPKPPTLDLQRYFHQY